MGSACSTQKALKDVEEPQRFSTEKPKKVVKPSASKNDQKASLSKEEEELKPISNLFQKEHKQEPVHIIHTHSHSSEHKKSTESLIPSPKVSKANRPLSKYEKRDEVLASQWENYLYTSSCNKYIEDEQGYYFEIANSFPDCYFLDTEDIDMETIVFVRVRGYETVVATMIQTIDESKDDLAILTSIHISQEVERDKILHPILQNMVKKLPEQVEKPFTITEERRYHFIESTDEFNDMMEHTENALILIEENKSIPLEFKGSTYMYTCLGMPLLHYAVSKDNFSAVETLLNMGAKPAQRDSNSNTALFYVKSLDMLKKLEAHLDFEIDLFRPNNNDDLVSHYFSSLYHEDRNMGKQLIEELSLMAKKTESPYESILKLFWGLNKQNSTALQILGQLVTKKALKLSGEEKSNFISEETKWQVELNIVKPSNFNIVDDRYDMTPLEMAVFEENIPLIHHYLTTGNQEDCRPNVLRYVKSVLVAKMLHHFYPSVLDKRDVGNSTNPSNISRIIQNMRSGNIPLVTFLVETYNYKLSIVEINQLIELSLNSENVEILELVEKVISNSDNLICQVSLQNPDAPTNRKDVFQSNKFEQSPLEYILSVHSDIPNSVMLQQVIWNRVKELCSDDEFRTSLKQQCGYIIQQCLLMGKIEMFKEILTFLKSIGLNHDDLKYRFESSFRSLRQNDMIYNALASLLYSSNNISSVLSDDFLSTVAQLSSDDGSDAPILHILVCLFLKKADLKIVIPLLNPNTSVETLDGTVKLFDDDMRSWVKNWVGGVIDSQFLKKYLLKPYEHSYSDVKKSAKYPKERNTAFKLEMPKVRQYILQHYIDSNAISEKINDSNFDSPNAFAILDTVASCIKEIDGCPEWEQGEFMKAVTHNLSLLKERVEKDDHFWMKEDVLIEIEMLKACLGLSKPDFTNFHNQSPVLHTFEKYYKIKNKHLSIESFIGVFLKADFKKVLLFCLSHSCLHMLTPELLKEITPAQQQKVSKFLYSFGTFNEKNRNDVEKLLEWISSFGKQAHLLSLLKTAISVGNVKITKKLISSFMNNNLQLSVDDIVPITDSILSVFRGGCDKLLSSLICEFLSMDQILSLKSESNETPLHSICYGGCTETLQLIHVSLDSSVFSKMFLDKTFKAGIEIESEENEMYPTHYFAYLSGKPVIRRQCLSILRDLSSKGMVESMSLFGNWSRTIGSLNMIIKYNEESDNNTLVAPDAQYSMENLVRAYWMKYYIDNSESFRFDDRFIKFFIYHFVAQRDVPSGEVCDDMLFNCFSSRNPTPTNIWTSFFESVLFTSAYENLTTFFLTSTQHGKTELDEDSLIRLLNLYHKTLKMSGSSIIEDGLVEVFTLGDLIDDNLIGNTIVRNRTKLMKIISNIIEGTPGLKSKIFEAKSTLFEQLATLMHPTLENKSADVLFSLFNIKESLYASETQELAFEYETPRISKNISDDMIIAHSIGRSVRKWKMERAVDQFIEHLKEETGIMFNVFFFPSLENLTTPMAQIMTGTTCISSVVATIRPLLEKKPINTLCVVMNAKQKGFVSNIYEEATTVEIKLSISKEDNNTLIVAPFNEEGNKQVAGE